VVGRWCMGLIWKFLEGFGDEGVRLSHGRNIRKGAWVRGIVGSLSGVLEGEEDVAFQRSAISGKCPPQLPTMVPRSTPLDGYACALGTAFARG
jgi:hypothetical protein